MSKVDSNAKISFPEKLISPIRRFLEGELMKMKRTEKQIKMADPFKDENRSMSNSDEEDVDEQIGHFDAEVKVSFVKKQIVQLRKALTRIKIGRYGICERCNKMIDTDRLAIKPEATICIKCEKESE